jgi:Family of unknown function (DUF6283)
VKTDVKRPKRKQCTHCPWKLSTNPHEIPNGYSTTKHRSLLSTVRPGLESLVGGLRMMACHESKVGKELPCVGWIANQAGIGNNLGLRLALLRGVVDGNVETVGPQHETLEETFPDDESNIEDDLYGDEVEDNR